MLPAQLTPSPVYPFLQVHLKERLVLVQYASLWQLCCPVSHSSTIQQVKVSYKNSLDFKVFTQSSLFQFFNSYFDYLSCFFWTQTTDIMISWLKLIQKTLVSILQDQKSTNQPRRQLWDLGRKINHPLQPIFTSKKMIDDLRETELKPTLVNQQNVVYKFKCDLCDANYIGCTCRHLHQRVVEHKHSVKC